MPLQVDSRRRHTRLEVCRKIQFAIRDLSAIKSAMYPQSSPYLYYLHDKNGVVHYAKTFAEHEEEIQKYL